MIEQIEPLKNENAKLVRENNELHQQMIKVKEDATQMQSSFSQRMRSVEGQSQDLNFVNGQSANQISQLESENTALKRQLEAALANGPDSQQTLDGKRVSFAGAQKAPGFELSHTLSGENNDPNGRGGFGAYQG